MYFTANPNGEAEVVRVALKPALHLKKLEVIKDLSELAIKSRSARGNVRLFMLRASGTRTSSLPPVGSCMSALTEGVERLAEMSIWRQRFD